MFLVPCDASVDLRRIEDNIFLRELKARMLLRDMQWEVNGESRREEGAMVVILHGLVQKNK